MGHIFLVLCTLNYFGSCPEYFEGYIEEPLDSFLLFRRVLIFFFLSRQLTWLYWNYRLCPTCSRHLLKSQFGSFIFSWDSLLVHGSSRNQRLGQSLCREICVPFVWLLPFFLVGFTPHSSATSSALGSILRLLCPRDGGFSTGIPPLHCDCGQHRENPQKIGTHLTSVLLLHFESPPKSTYRDLLSRVLR